MPFASSTLSQKFAPVRFAFASRCPRSMTRQIAAPFIAAALLTAISSNIAHTQDRLPAMPGYARYRAQSRKLRDLTQASQAGVVSGAWSDDNKAYLFRKGDKRYRCDIATGRITETQEPVPAGRMGMTGRGGGAMLERGRQATTAVSPDSKWTATYQGGNISLRHAGGADVLPVTTDGGRQKRVFYGTASWVYGEELEQHTAMWWSPDSKKLAYYGFDESKVPDYYVTLDTLEVQDTLDAEPYPKAGAPNPVVDLYVYDVETHRSERMDVRGGRPFTDDAMGHYVYDVRWSPDGSLLLFNRTNRLQNALEFTACDPKTGQCRPIVRETSPMAWTTNSPHIAFLKDGQRFVWASERDGWRNLYLYNLSGKNLARLTHLSCDVERIARVDEGANVLYYMAHDGDVPMKQQLHRVLLDGTGDTRLTDPHFQHRIDLAPDGGAFVDVYQTHDQPPATQLVRVPDARFQNIPQPILLAQGDTTALRQAGFAPPEQFTYKAADGKTDLYGLLYKPSDFDPNRKYPLLVDVYAGPDTPQAEMVTENFRLGRGLTEMGFLVASFDGRGTTGRGAAFRDAVYGRLGQAEIDDQAAGVKFLDQRLYVDANRVGIYGTSYGGYASLMCLLRYPDVFRAASASSAVTDWRNYDSIYTERFMGLPAQNVAGYASASAMAHVKSLKGKLLLYYGTADNNVHPANTLQLISALGQAGKSYDLQIGPDAGHTGVNQNRMIEFFLDAFTSKPEHDNPTAGR